MTLAHRLNQLERRVRRSQDATTTYDLHEQIRRLIVDSFESPPPAPVVRSPDEQRELDQLAHLIAIGDVEGFDELLARLEDRQRRSTVEETTTALHRTGGFSGCA